MSISYSGNYFWSTFTMDVHPGLVGGVPACRKGLQLMLFLFFPPRPFYWAKSANLNRLKNKNNFLLRKFKNANSVFWKSNWFLFYLAAESWVIFTQPKITTPPILSNYHSPKLASSPTNIPNPSGTFMLWVLLLSALCYLSATVQQSIPAIRQGGKCSMGWAMIQNFRWWVECPTYFPCCAVVWS